MMMTRTAMDRPQARPVSGPNSAPIAAWMCMIAHATRSASGLRMLTGSAPRWLGGMYTARHRVVTAGIKRMAPCDALDREPEPARRAVLGHRGERVLTARGREPAPRGQQRAHEPPVTRDGDHEQPGWHRHGAALIVLYGCLWHYRRVSQPAAAATC